MINMDRWDWVLLAAVGFVALVVLVQLMLNQRNRLLIQLRADIEREQARKRQEEQAAKEHAEKKQQLLRTQQAAAAAQKAPAAAKPAAKGNAA